MLGITTVYRYAGAGAATMTTSDNNYFDRSASQWDKEPHRIALMKAVGETILREAKPTSQMDVLDYGCGTGLVGLFLLPHVRSVTGADSSSGMLEVLRSKIVQGDISNMTAIHLDLERESVPPARFHMIVSSMVMHHVAEVSRVLRAFHEMLLPGGIVCIADLDTEPGVFHPDEAAAGVHHHGFDRSDFGRQLEAAGFKKIRASTAHVVQKPVVSGVLHEFPVFLIVAQQED